jgi:hypothetical protein
MMLPLEKKMLYKATPMYKNLCFEKRLVEPSFEFVSVLRFCVHVRKVKTITRSNGTSTSIPLPVMPKIISSAWTKFSMFHHRGSLPMLLSCKGPVRISVGTQTTLNEIVRSSPQSLSLQKYVRTATASFSVLSKPFTLYRLPIPG